MGWVWVETDLEPDDAFAIVAILHEAKQVGNNVAFVVGEGDSRLKLVLLGEILESLGENATSFRIIQGLDSSAAYPTKFLEPAWVEKAGKIDIIQPDVKLHVYMSMFSELQPGLAYFLKPPREALQLKNKIDFQECVCYCYGGFNYRATDAVIDDINSLASNFKEYHHFCRRVELPTGHDQYDFANKLKDGHNFTQMVRTLSLNWNAHYNEMRKVRDKPSKTIFVMADVLCVYRSTDGVTIRGQLMDYDSVQEMKDGPVLFTSEDREKRRAGLMARIDVLLSSFL